MKITKKIDVLGMGCSILCLVHCMLLPLLSIATLSFIDSKIEKIMFGFMFIIGTVNLIYSFLKHYSYIPLFIFILSVIIIVLSAYNYIKYEIFFHVLGSGGIMISHLFNIKSMKKIQN